MYTASGAPAVNPRLFLNSLGIRQWVISFPIPVRYWMARNPKLITQALEIFHRALKSHYKKAAKNLGIEGEVLTGAVTVVQRWGSALNLNIHFHSVVADGVFVVQYRQEEKTVKFVETKRPTQAEIMRLVQTVQLRMLRALQRRGLVKKLESESGGEVIESDETIEAACQGASAQYRIATSKNPGQPVRRIGSLGFVGEDPAPTGEFSAIIGGYSIHAGTSIAKNNRTELERLFRYILRPPVAEDRIDIRGENIIYKLKSQWRDGTQAIMHSGTEFIEKLVAIIPQPRIHITRFHGILAPHAELRSLVVPSTPHQTECQQGAQAIDETKSKRHKKPRLRWAELLRRVLNVDLETCPCGGKLKFIAAIMDRDSITKILDHLGLSTHVPEFAPP